MRRRNWLVVSVLAGLLAMLGGCSSDSSSSDSTSSTTTSDDMAAPGNGETSSGETTGGQGSDEDLTAARFDGSYRLSATPTTPVDRDGGTCGTAEGMLTLLNGALDGQAVDSNGNVFTLTGTVSEAGELEAGLALGDDNTASFTGTVSNGRIEGQWQDRFGCAGSWTALLSGTDGAGETGETGETGTDGGGSPSPDLGFDGSYDLVATPLPVLTDCAAATGTLLVSGSSLSGQARDDNDVVYQLNGMVTAAGVINLGLAFGGTIRVDFEGRVVDGIATGTWSDSFGCQGSWTATLRG